MKIRVNNSKNDLLDPDSFSQHGAKPSGFRQSADHLLHGKIPRQSPRLRGNHDTNAASRRSMRGSPPLAREPLQTQLPWKPQDWDHPRLRGNHMTGSAGMPAGPGSPPLAREPPFKNENDFWTARITPACAGTTNNIPIHFLHV